MVRVFLPNGNSLEFNNHPSGFEIAKKISLSLIKSAICMYVNDELKDLSFIVEKDSKVSIVRDIDPIGLDVIRHDTAHILAQAVKELYGASLAIGPTIEDGFFYDIESDKQISTDDFPEIEKKMHDIASRNLEIKREVLSRTDAINYFTEINEKYKVELISGFQDNSEITVYKQGNFVDLCRGPHSSSTKNAKYFKLMKISGVYWRGNSNNSKLQRIYGTAWTTNKDLESYLYKLEEAAKRDHRKIAQALDLFHIEENNPGMVLWHSNGYTIFRCLEDYIRRKILKNGYVEVKTPIIANSSLWNDSGHLEKFSENIFIFNNNNNKNCDNTNNINISNTSEYVLKPMNCPLHIQIFKQGIKSYKDLPLRMSEFGCCHRKESSGSLHGLMRVMSFTQDDAHIFCTESQIEDETIKFCELLYEIYESLGFLNVSIKLSNRPEKRLGDDRLWDKSEEALELALKRLGSPYVINEGEGAFYGPKLEFILTDSLGREWQCGTLQLDFILPDKLSAKYVDNNGKFATPVMLHRAILGTLERFIGIMIEHYSGALPLYFSPIQIVVIPISSTNELQISYCNEIINCLKDNRIDRSIIDTENKTLDYKLRLHSSKKIPYILIVGDKEVANKNVSFRKFGDLNTQKEDMKQFICNLLLETQIFRN